MTRLQLGSKTAMGLVLYDGNCNSPPQIIHTSIQCTFLPLWLNSLALLKVLRPYFAL